MDSAALITRLKDQVPSLRRVGLAADLDAVLAGKLADQTGASAFVVALGEQAGPPAAAAGAHLQDWQETIAVILVLREVSNRAGDRAADALEELKAAVRAALAGWAPPGAFAPYAVSRGAVISFRPGYLAYALEFIGQDQLRILA